MTVTSTPTPSPTGGSGLSAGESAAIQQFLAGSGSASSGPGNVFMGMKPPKATPRDTRSLSESAQAQLGRRGATAAPNWMDAATATNQYFTWSQKARDDFRAKGLLSGLLTQGAGDLESFSLWQNLVKQASLYGAQKQQVSPLDILSGYVKGNSSGGWIRSGDFETNPLTGEKRYVGPKSKTTTQTQIDLTDPATARAIAVKQFQDLMGRDPNQGEIAAYASALSQSEIQNPSSATTTTQFDMTTGNAADSSTVTAGGLTPEAKAQIAADAIKQTKEYGATQAATTYMDALHSAVGI